jgi:glucose dehydrogenase
MDEWDFEVPVDQVLKGANKYGDLQDVVIIGFTKDGELWVSSSCKFDRMLSLLLQGQHYMIRWEEGRKQVIVEESGDE